MGEEEEKEEMEGRRREGREGGESGEKGGGEGEEEREERERKEGRGGKGRGGPRVPTWSQTRAGMEKVGKTGLKDKEKDLSEPSTPVHCWLHSHVLQGAVFNGSHGQVPHHG